MRGVNNTVLVTGAAGFIGSFVAARLSDMGCRVIGVDNFNNYYSPQLKNDRVNALLSSRNIECLPVELANPMQVRDLFDRIQPNRVVHLAAQAGVRYSLQNPSAYIQSNLVGFANILESCREHNVQHMLYASSSSVYGANVKVPFHEDDRVDEPVSLYAATKKSNELMAYSYSHLYGFAATGLRFFTVYGPWGRPDMAYFIFSQKMLKGEPIQVFSSGELQRDFTYIDDIVEGVVRLLFKPTPAVNGKPPHAIFNIGNHRPVKVMDFVRMLEKVLDRKAKIEFLPMQDGDVPATYADSRRLQEWVEFSPSTPLELGLSRFSEWYFHWLKTLVSK